LVETIEQVDVEAVEARFGLERELQAAALDLVAELDAAIALFAEEGIAEDDVRLAHGVAQPLDLVHDVPDRSRAITRENPVRAVGAELGTPAAGEQRVAAADRTRRPLDAEAAPAVLGDEVPARERQRVEVVDLFRDRNPGRDHARLREAHHAGFGFALEDEVAVALEELRHLRRRDADEADLDALRAHLVGPLRLVLVVDKRREHE